MCTKLTVYVCSHGSCNVMLYMYTYVVSASMELYASYGFCNYNWFLQSQLCALYGLSKNIIVYFIVSLQVRISNVIFVGAELAMCV